MAASNINRVVLTGNLTFDPELRSLQSGSSVCKLRIASNTRRKDASGEWVDKPNYFDVTVWGAQGENCARYLSKGRGVAIDGRLEWREWQDQQGNKRQSVEIVADSVQFLGGGEGGQGGGFGGQRSGGQGEQQGGGFSSQTDVPVNTNEFQAAPVGGGSAPTGDDDIPF
ncbi:single-stranded DNA-binding protein [Paraconexibacter sp.]|uniref:single-stranded DNA-binding protein n=1 Tax=Paraconexibacter sp. TaxID=2949640 RepID=UPI00356A39B4